MSQFVGRFPIDAVVLPNIEMKVCQFVFRQVQDHRQITARRVSSFIINSTPLPGAMRDQETGASYLGNNLVAYFVGVLLRIDAKRSIAGGRSPESSASIIAIIDATAFLVMPFLVSPTHFRNI